MFVVPKESLQDMVRGSDVIAVGKFTGIAERGFESDYSSGAGGQGAPTALWDFEVERVIKGSAEPTLRVARLDLDRVATDAQGPTPMDERVVLFLQGPSEAGAYGVVAVDQGLVALRDGDQLQWRGKDLGGLLGDLG